MGDEVQAEELVVEHMELARRIARKMGGRLRDMNPDDIESAALLGLLLAARNYKPDGRSFVPWATVRIKGEILDESRRQDHLGRDHREHVTAGRAQDPLVRKKAPADVVERVGTAPTDVDTNMGMRDIKKLLRHLPARLQLVARLRFVEEKSLTEIGERLQVTESRTCQILREVEERLRIRLLPHENVDKETALQWRREGGCKVRRTHCMRGHPLVGHNLRQSTITIVRKTGIIYTGPTRACRRCIAERTRRARWVRGTLPFDAFKQPRHKLAKLSNTQVREILEGLMAGERVWHLSRRFGVAPRVIRLIRDDQTYRDVPRPPGFTGEVRPKGILFPSQVRNIVVRIERGERNMDLAAEFGVSPATISDIRYGRAHRGISGHLRETPPPRLRNGQAKLTDGQVRAARIWFGQGMSTAEAARQLGVAFTTAKTVRDGVSYRWVA